MPSTRFTTASPPPSAPTSPQHDLDAPVLATPEYEFHPRYEEPLYTEINIPLPHIPQAKPSRPSEASSSSSSVALGLSSPPAKSRGRSRTLSSLSPFRRRSSSVSSLGGASGSKETEEWPRIRKDIVKSREVHAMMDLKHQNKRGRSGTIDALAVVPAVLVLSAELFTAGE
ncbi:uncharacterized protein K460DRAFT_83063 [Cucurbitaria berberidis CBS 394.84]|uniref:Uncharacterized protein n=1 Tax=Cucurbitaria berberidis CBS 394.84 TaxID=1168544 RepID=A0A9P4GNR1_9PLEO|nr:uncharacterized protein K460DRAFT_83063 [Cucurbitaria berberidis CBS 394.84]KAF1848940.1 hypothetical protein K460DRAFT_83063 [Cucurbitaria berberidis CBS 394.84]